MIPWPVCSERIHMKWQPRVDVASLSWDPCEQKQTPICLGTFDGVQPRSKEVNCIDLLWFLPAWWFYNPLHLVIHPNKASLLESMVSSEPKIIKYRNGTGKNCWWVRPTRLQGILEGSYCVSNSDFLKVVLEPPFIRIISGTARAKN